MADVQVTTLRLPKEIYEALRKLSFNRRESMSKIVTRLVRNYIKAQ